MISPGDDLVQSVSMYKDKHWIWHGHIGPFFAVYAAWLYIWSVQFGIQEYYEAGLISLAIIGLLQVLLCLSCYWSTHILAGLSCSKVGWSLFPIFLDFEQILTLIGNVKFRYESSKMPGWPK